MEAYNALPPERRRLYVDGEEVDADAVIREIDDQLEEIGRIDKVCARWLIIILAYQRQRLNLPKQVRLALTTSTDPDRVLDEYISTLSIQRRSRIPGCPIGRGGSQGGSPIQMAYITASCR